MKKLLYSFLICMPFIISAQCTEGDDLITNGSFETGDFTGWIVQDCVGAGAVSPVQGVETPGSVSLSSPIFSLPNVVDGSNYVVNGFDGIGPCEISMCQTVTIPSGVVSATFEWNEIVEWATVFGATVDRVHSVDVFDNATGNLIQNLHTINAAPNTTNDTLNTNGLWSNFTSDFTPYIGQTIDICFTETVPEFLTGPAMIYYDDISLITSCTAAPPTASVPTLSEWGLIFLAILMMTMGTLQVAGTAAFVGASNIQIPTNMLAKGLPFNNKLFTKAVIITLLLIGVGFSVSITLTGTIAFSDWIGTAFTAPLFTYFVHLLMVLENK